MVIIQDYSAKDKYIYRWLLAGCLLIILLVIVGGVTRLTQSGLSMVKWEPIMGTLPPMSDSEWNEAFNYYKESPEFHHYNSHFTLSDFKGIYFWEYLHRLLARVLGLVFIIPCLIFWFRKYFDSSMKKKVLLIFLFGTLQAVLGWVMVKSGLVDNPHVSHYRLAAHLLTAFGLIIYIFWVALSVKYKVVSVGNATLRKLLRWFLVVLVLQIMYGAFVAGLKAGWMYNTYPKMGSEWIPGHFGQLIRKDGIMSIFEHGGLVQFMHRTIALVLVILLSLIWWKGKKIEMSSIQSLAFNALFAILILQFLLGVMTLLYAVPVSLGVLHQLGAILLLIITTFFLYTLKERKTQLT